MRNTGNARKLLAKVTTVPAIRQGNNVENFAGAKVSRTADNTIELLFL